MGRNMDILYKWLESPPDTKDRQRDLLSCHHESTGGWLLRDARYMEWKTTPSFLWIKGISGTGKSVLSSTIIADIIETCPERSAVAYFFFDFRNDRQRLHIMLRSIVWQLSGRTSPPHGALHRLYKKLGDGTIQPQPPHLREVLEELLSELGRTYIVIDGLDECEKTQWNRLAHLIHSLCPPGKTVPHLLFTSQPLAEFQKAFKNVTFIDLSSAVLKDDIMSFTASEVSGVGNWASDDDPAVRVTEQIVQKSNGMFRMAACLLMELRDCYWKAKWEETLITLPGDLFGIYGRFLTRAMGKLPTVLVQAALRWLVFSARRLSSDELADAVAFHLPDLNYNLSNLARSLYNPENRRGNSESFQELGGLIVLQNNHWITLAHSSVKDYLLSTQFQGELLYAVAWKDRQTTDAKGGQD
ncbi:hypothetical protein DFH06DRAFT_1239963 [Mycena polygramma]|nr:hypothetical protein DFH06DRAFT_1239963 [Mycena polygramma]